MIEQRFWRKYLKGKHATVFAQNATVYNLRGESLLGRHLAGNLSGQDYKRELVNLSEERNQLLKTLTLRALNIPNK